MKSEERDLVADKGAAEFPDEGEQNERVLLSIVVPVYNEESNVKALYDKVIEVTSKVSDRYNIEFVFTDNRSTDRTFECVKELAATDPRVRAFRFSRNFGYQRSIHTGYSKCRGDVAIQLDCDLQDPPELIPDFLRLWEAGNQVVYGIRRQRQESKLLHFARRFFYVIVDSLSEQHLPRNAGDFRLIDRRIINELNKIKDPKIYLRGRIAEIGFNQIGIEYDRDPRREGKSKFNFKALSLLAVDAIIGSSIAPLRYASYLGFALTIISLLLAVSYVVVKLTLGSSWPPGFLTLTILLIMSIGLNGLFIGILGEYIARLHARLLTPVETIIDETIDPI
ncbi:MAG: glycosyltransferase family 2 protein [Proteobacteria bacterium]|nr:glycosyltransferase family 2 protein [Pseudomonadota bacterium]